MRNHRQAAAPRPHRRPLCTCMTRRARRLAAQGTERRHWSAAAPLGSSRLRADMAPASLSRVRPVSRLRSTQRRRRCIRSRSRPTLVDSVGRLVREIVGLSASGVVESRSDVCAAVPCCARSIPALSHENTLSPEEPCAAGIIVSNPTSVWFGQCVNISGAASVLPSPPAMLSYRNRLRLECEMPCCSGTSSLSSSSPSTPVPCCRCGLFSQIKWQLYKTSHLFEILQIIVSPTWYVQLGGN